MKRHPSNFTGLLYIEMMGGQPFLQKADKLVLISPEFMKAVRGHDFVTLIPLPDGTEMLRVRAVNRTVYYQIARNRTTGHLYGELIEGAPWPQPG